MNDEQKAKQQRAEELRNAPDVQLSGIQRLRIRKLFQDQAKGGKPCDKQFLLALLRRRPKDSRLVDFPTKEIMDQIDAILAQDQEDPPDGKLPEGLS